MFWIPLFLFVAQSTQEVTVRRASNWNPSANDGWCAIKVWVDDEADFTVQGERLRMYTSRGQDARDVASECNRPLPSDPTSFRFRGIDGRGEVRLIQEPTRSNRGQAVVRIRDTKSGGEEYHFRLEWTGGTSYDNRGNSSGGFFGNNNSNNSGNRQPVYNNNADASRMRTRELRREIENMSNNVRGGRRLSNDDIDDYIDRVRLDRWSLNDVANDIQRRR